MRLSQKDFDALQKVILELYDLSNLDSFKQRLPHVVLKIIPAEYSSLCTYALAAQPKLTNYSESAPRITRPAVGYAERHILSHPFTEYFMRTKDVTALKLTDFMNVHQLRSSSMWEPFFQPMEMKYVLSVSTAGSPGAVSAISLTSKSKDFSERDRLILNLLRPHIMQAGRTAELISALRKAQVPGALPDSLKGACGFTPRERQVAHWVMEGKSNPEIAIILGASPRTIEKHMENILAKLGVENRTAAAAMLTRTNLAFGGQATSEPVAAHPTAGQTACPTSSGR